jgi:Lectin C-type domain
MKNLIQAAVVTLFSASTAQAQQAPPCFRRVSIADQANIRAQNWNCPGFTNGGLYPLGEAVYAGVPFQHGPADHYAFMGGHYCGDPPRALDLQISAPGTATIYALLNSWGGCGTRGPDFLVTISFADGTSKTWTLADGIDYRDHNGSCPLTGSRSQEVWSSGFGQRLDMLTLPAEEPGKSISRLRIESADLWSDVAAPFIFGITIGDSQDCNGDGIADWSQCHDGTLADYNGNNIPDCCERRDACVVGNYPVQWRVEDGGNGHWYLPQQAASDCWDQSRLTATQLGGHLATVTSSPENQFVAGLVRRFYGSNITIGGYKDLSAGVWRWVTDESWQYTNWQAGEPGCCAPEEWWLDMNMMTGEWRDRVQCVPPVSSYPGMMVIEFDADCNHDGVVDYGQILQGQLADLNADGVPDICQQPTCRDADLYRNNRIDGADLGILLSEWGPVTPSTNSDINHDGFVNGADLGIMLSFWGACPN